MAGSVDAASLHIEKTGLVGLLILTPRRITDERGFFSESRNGKTLRAAGVDLAEFVQDTLGSGPITPFDRRLAA